ncbi:MAG TPA: hypothetical protein VFK42_17685 [Acidimicrobiales bacterium]|nr:hypothetical protein [Acidimicrobiales bacterium]
MLWLHEERGLRRLRRAVVVLLVAGFVSFLARGADRPKNPSLQSVPGAPVAPAPSTNVLPGEP